MAALMFDSETHTISNESFVNSLIAIQSSPQRMEMSESRVIAITALLLAICLAMNGLEFSNNNLINESTGCRNRGMGAIIQQLKPQFINKIIGQLACGLGLFSLAASFHSNNFPFQIAAFILNKLIISKTWLDVFLYFEAFLLLFSLVAFRLFVSCLQTGRTLPSHDRNITHPLLAHFIRRFTTDNMTDEAFERT